MLRALLLAILLCLPVQLAGQGQGRTIIFSEPVIIGVYSMDVAEVYDSLPEIATAEWPAFTPGLLAELAACTRLPVPVGWEIRTVAGSGFMVRWWDEDEKVWQAGRVYVGWTFPHVRRIYVAQDGLYTPWLIKHELLHAVLAAGGIDPRHNTLIADRMFARCLP